MTAFTEWLWIESTCTVKDFSTIVSNANKNDASDKQAENVQQQYVDGEQLHIKTHNNPALWLKMQMVCTAQNRCS